MYFLSTPTLPSTEATGVHVIPAYTYDSQDHKDAMRMRATLRTPGIEQKINDAMLTDKGEIILPTAYNESR